MKRVRVLAAILFYVSRVLAVLELTILLYALIVLGAYYMGATGVPVQVENSTFTIFYPFTTNAFLLGDYTASYLWSNFSVIAFYGIFLWLLSEVFHAFKQPRLFTQKGLAQLSRFYFTNLVVPLSFLLVLAVFGLELMDILRITLLHMVIGVFAFFMAAIFRQGLVLQEEQDLIF